MRTILFALVFFAGSTSSASEPIIPRIIMHSSDDCGPCNNWWANHRPNWERVGWRVEKILELKPLRALPWYRVHDGDGVTFEVSEPLTPENFKASKAKVTQRTRVTIKTRSWLE